MVLIAKDGSSSRPSRRYDRTPATTDASIRNKTNERWLSPHSDRLKRVIAVCLWRGLRRPLLRRRRPVHRAGCEPRQPPPCRRPKVPSRRRSLSLSVPATTRSFGRATLAPFAASTQTYRPSLPSSTAVVGTRIFGAMARSTVTVIVVPSRNAGTGSSRVQQYAVRPGDRIGERVDLADARSGDESRRRLQPYTEFHVRA